jgi:hypothetical protein
VGSNTLDYFREEEVPPQHDDKMWLLTTAVLVLTLTTTSVGSSSVSAAPSAASSSSSEPKAVGVETPAVGVTPEELGKADFRLAFGSCSRHDRPQSLWGAVRGMKADAFVWLGDAVYADIKASNKTRVYLGNDFLVDAYTTQNAHPEYSKLVAETRVLGTWWGCDGGRFAFLFSFPCAALTTTPPALPSLIYPAAHSQRLLRTRRHTPHVCGVTLKQGFTHARRVEAKKKKNFDEPKKKEKKITRGSFKVVMAR